MTFKDFADWAGGQAIAGRLIGIHKLRAHRLYHGAPMKPDEASRIEAASKGLFSKESLIFGSPCGDSRTTAQLPHNRARVAPVPDSKHPASRPNDDGHVGGADSSE